MDIEQQQCQICHKNSDLNLAFRCHRCARNAIYEPRLELANTLLARESLSKEIETVIRQSQREPDSGETIQEASKTFELDVARSEYRLIAARTQTILDDSRRLQENIEALRMQLAELKAGVAKRRRAIKSATQEIRYEEDTSVKTLRDSIAVIEPAWARIHSRTVSGRHVLTRELASLYGLQIRKRRKIPSTRDSFTIAGIPVFNLKELNNASPERLNTSTYHVAHMIHLTSHYLGLRLPAELSMATAGQPLTYIHPPMSSYKLHTLNTRSQDSGSAKTAPRKRILWIEKPLPQLASEDPQAYSLYLDAVILLAWNVAWMAKSQGIDVGGNGWEDICLVGKNLWDLFGESSRLEESSTSQPRNGSTQDVVNLASASQASAYSFLNSGGSNGAGELIRTWKYATPTRIIETIKSALINERMGADWEVLEKPEEEEAIDGSHGQSSNTGENNTVSVARTGKEGGYTVLDSRQDKQTR